MEASITVFLHRGRQSAVTWPLRSNRISVLHCGLPCLTCSPECWICAALDGVYVASWGCFTEMKQRQFRHVCEHSYMYLPLLSIHTETCNTINSFCVCQCDLLFAFLKCIFVWDVVLSHGRVCKHLPLLNDHGPRTALSFVCIPCWFTTYLELQPCATLQYVMGCFSTSCWVSCGNM